MPLTIGTAGHIDHGKTWLVRALTGKDTDRLPEERARGISIELGYAPLDLPDGRRLSVIDVPGHERFVRTMVAGATGIDLFLLAIDAAEGARAQTHEHLAILRLLGVENGVVAVTKADAVDSETLGLAVAEARELVPGADVVAVSARTGQGLDALRAALARAADGSTGRDADDATRLWIDRVFPLRGIGTVVTGTLWSGSVGRGDVLRAEPGRRSGIRVRSVQVHDRTVARADAGQRVAVNLTGIERQQLGRGDVLVEPGRFPVTYRLAVALDELAPVPPAVTVHLGTKDVAARVVRDGHYAQLRLREPVAAARGDRVILRAATTVGGALVLDPLPPRRLDSDRLASLERGTPEEIVRATIHEPVTRPVLQARGLLAPAELERGLAAVECAGEYYFSGEWLDHERARVRAQLAERARTSPLDPGIPVPELLGDAGWVAAVADLLGVEQRGGKAYLPGTAPALRNRAAAAIELRAALARAEADAIRVADRAIVAFLEAEGELVRLADGFVVRTDAYEGARRTLIRECERTGAIRLARFRDLLGISRRSAQLLLERFDADAVTRRVGDERVLRKRAAARRANESSAAGARGTGG